MAKKVEKNGLNIREWVRERILFLAVGIFVVGGTGYIAAGKVLDNQNIWLISLELASESIASASHFEQVLYAMDRCCLASLRVHLDRGAGQYFRVLGSFRVIVPQQQK